MGLSDSLNIFQLYCLVGDELAIAFYKEFIVNLPFASITFSLYHVGKSLLDN